MKKENNKLDIKNIARSKYWQGYRVSAIASDLNIKASTVYSWVKRGKWDTLSPINRAHVNMTERLIFLINKPEKSNKEIKEIDQLTSNIIKLDKTINPPAPVDKAQRRGGRSKISSKKNYFTEEQITELKKQLQEMRFDYQKQWGACNERNRIILKSRQIGATFYFAGEALESAIDTGQNQIFLSASLRQSLIFKNYIKKYAGLVDVELEGDNITLWNGASMFFLGTNSRTAQGETGNVYMDEFSWIPKFLEFKELAQTMASQKRFRKTFMSTPSYEGSEAHQFWMGEEYNQDRSLKDQIIFDLSAKNLQKGMVYPDEHFRQLVTIYDAEAGGCDLFDIEKLKREYSDSAFKRLFMGDWGDEASSVFTLRMLQNCQVDSYEKWRFYKKFARRPVGNLPVWIGYDPSRSSDAAGLVAMLPPSSSGSNKWHLLESMAFDAQNSFEKQADVIQSYCDIFNVEKIVMDVTGVGYGVAERVRDFFPHLTELTYSNEEKANMIRKTQKILQDKRFEYDSYDMDFTTSMTGIKERLTRGGNKIAYVSSRRNKNNHGDVAWAALNLFNEESFAGEVDSPNDGILIIN